MQNLPVCPLDDWPSFEKMKDDGVCPVASLDWMARVLEPPKDETDVAIDAEESVGCRHMSKILTVV